jgi:hypothetical protein
MQSRMTLVASAAAVSLLLAMAGVAGAYDQDTIPYQRGDPLTNGCPSGWEALQVTDLTDASSNYQLPGHLDATANGGNGDGVVCGKPFTPQEQAAQFPNAVVPVVFYLRDNDLPSVKS